MRLLPLSAFEHIFEPLAGKAVGYIPLPGNPGDHMIDVATFQCLTAFGIGWTIGPDPFADVFLIAGGGSMGSDEYTLCREVRLRALSIGSSTGRPVWVLPQSWHGRDSEADLGRYVRLFARERYSLAFAPAKTELAPDLSLALSVGPFPPPTHGRGVWLRRDAEGLFADHPENLGDPVTECLLREDAGWSYLELGARHEEIVTDRLHYAIAGLIAGRKVTLLPNSYWKNKGLWEANLAALGCGWADSPDDAERQ